MSAQQKRIFLWTMIALPIVAFLIYLFTPRAEFVDLIEAKRGAMTVTLDEEAKTRVHDVFVLSAPVVGHVQRIQAHVGDPVQAGITILASIEPGDAQFLDPRSETQARAALLAAESAVTLARAEVEQATAERDFAETEYRRARRLIGDGTIARRDFEAAERAFKTTRAALATAQAALQMRTYEVDEARAQLVSPADQAGQSTDCACVDLKSPVDGQVLEIFERSARVVTAGTPLLEIGDPKDLEIVADYLSTDAVRIASGQQVLISNWGGSRDLDGVVRRVEPYAFTKVSALGIKEQRVNVVIDLVSPPQDWRRLGHGYQVKTQVVLWQSDRALALPLTALFRIDKQWSVFVVENGRATLRTIRLGQRNGLVAEIVDGIAPGEYVVLHPSDRIRDGVSVRSRG